jgi:hypothetical protein
VILLTACISRSDSRAVAVVKVDTLDVEGPSILDLINHLFIHEWRIFLDKIKGYLDLLKLLNKKSDSASLLQISAVCIDHFNSL